MATLTEVEFRQVVDQLFRRIVSKLEAVDPDLVECDSSNGSLTLFFSDQSKCIVSVQPSVRQIWMAVSKLGIAIHFSWNSDRNLWFDDKTQKMEFCSKLSEVVNESTSLAIEFGS